MLVSKRKKTNRRWSMDNTFFQPMLSKTREQTENTTVITKNQGAELLKRTGLVTLIAGVGVALIGGIALSAASPFGLAAGIVLLLTVVLLVLAGLSFMFSDYLGEKQQVTGHYYHPSPSY